MKVSNILKIIGFILLPMGITLIVIGCTVLAHYPFGDPSFSKMSNMGMVVPGAIICLLSIALIIEGFRPALTKISAKLGIETLEAAGNDVQKALMKSTEIASPAISSVTKTIKNEFKNNACYCKMCGKEIDTDSKYCKYCGNKQ